MPLRIGSYSGKPQSLEIVRMCRIKDKSDTGTKVVLAKTNELSCFEQEQMRNLFFCVFGKRMTNDMFERKFLYTTMGYSYHGLTLHDGAIVGAFSVVPKRYTFFGEELIFGLSVDTMVDPKYRGRGHWIKMAALAHESLIKEGIPFIFGCPNDLFYPMQKRFLKYTDIGELDYYVMPLNIGAVIQKLKIFNWFSRGLFGIINKLSMMPSYGECEYHIAKIMDNEFERNRYDNSYVRIALGDGAACFYKLYELKGVIRTFCIIDVFPLTPAFFAESVKRVYKAAVGSVDMITYAGRLPFRPTGFLRIPHFMKPGGTKMTGKILIPEAVDDSVFDIKNWIVNWSDFDVW